MIREAREEDIPALLEMGRRFVATAWAGLLASDDESLRATLEGLLGGGVLLVAEAEGRVCGMLGAVVTPLYVNHAETIAQELFWWVEPEARGLGIALLDAFENEARKRGATIGGMNLMEALRGDAVARLYERRGYRAMERAFMRRL